MVSSRRSTRLVCAGLGMALIAGCHHRSEYRLQNVPAADATTIEPGALASRGQDSRSTTANSTLLTAPTVATSRIEDLFSGRFPGLEVHRTVDGVLSMRLRGEEPLLVIDGLVADPVALVSVTPNSVERIEVLRNVSETAIYGTRGVNGVVIVTTRR